MKGNRLFDHIRKDIRSSLLSFLSFAVILLITIESFSLFQRSEAINRLILEQVETIAKSKLVTNDFMGLQQELTHFVASFRNTLPYSIMVRVHLDDKLIAGDGDLAESIISPSTIRQVSVLPSGHRMNVVAEVGLKRTFIEVLLILAVILIGCFGLYRFLLFKLEKSFDRDSDPIQKKLDEAKAQEQRVLLAEQVAHDIRSPLATLSAIIQEAPLNESDKETVAKSLTRIQAVLGDIRKRPFETQALKAAKTLNEKTEEILNSLVEEIVNEKRRQWSDSPGISIDLVTPSEAVVFPVLVDKKEVIRVLSNLLDNAHQAITSGKGHISISFKPHSEFVSLLISDDGKGMTAAEIASLGDRGVSFGKVDGTGLGVSHAMQVMKSIGGSLSFESVYGEGTTAVLKFEKSAGASPIISSVSLRRGQTIVIADDDTLVHQAFGMKLQGFDLNVVSVYSPEEFERLLKDETDFAFFFIDYDFKGHAKNGVDLISQYELQKRSVLVSGQVDVPEIKLRCEYFGISRFPKSHLSALPISYSNQQEIEVNQSLNQ